MPHAAQSTVPMQSEAAGTNGTADATAPLPHFAGPAAVAKLEVNTPEWDVLTARRAYLIGKKNTPGCVLTSDEEAEFERLQRASWETVERTFPLPRMSPEDRALVDRVLARDAGGDSR